MLLDIGLSSSLTFTVGERVDASSTSNPYSEKSQFILFVVKYDILDRGIEIDAERFSASFSGDRGLFTALIIGDSSFGLNNDKGVAWPLLLKIPRLVLLLLLGDNKSNFKKLLFDDELS